MARGLQRLLVQHKTLLSLSLIATMMLLVMPAGATAQTDSSIAGVARDSSGGVLPGVTVEAASPALIEKVRSVVTDGEGQYKILGLRPGVYSVTFTMPGFSTFRREGIELTSSFTATVSADLRVGSLEETITVSGATPLVDTQSVVQQKVISSETIAAIPMGRQLKAMAVALNPAVNTNLADFDMGGSSGDAAGSATTVHGSRGNDGTFHYDGLRFSGIGAAGHGFAALKINMGNVNEIAVEVAGMSAEQETAGVRLNIIPREGGNSFSGLFHTSYTNHDFQSDNLSDSLKASGLLVTDTMEKIWDVNASLGGKIKRDKLWFYTSHRTWGAHRGLAGAFYDTVPYDFVYTPDLDRGQVIGKTDATNQSLRLTWQASQKDKFNIHYEISTYQTPINLNRLVVWEAHNWYDQTPNYLASVSWTKPVTSRLLLEAAGAFVNASYNTKTPNYEGVEGGRDIAGVVEQSTNTRFRAYNGGTLYLTSLGKQTNQRFSASYVTGSHAFKVGGNFQMGWQTRYIDKPGDMELTLNLGKPVSLIQWVAPQPAWNNMKADMGMYAQDQWTVNNLTVNAGLRFDYLNTYVPEQHLPATRFLPALDLAEVPNVPNFKDLSPRLGVSYALFGDGKTALKASLGKYQAAVTMQLAEANNPARGAMVLQTSRQWDDKNGNFIPEGDFLNPDLNNELGPMNDRAFGTTRITTHYTPETLVGWGQRFHNWEGMVGIQRELMTGLSANASYHRRWYDNFVVTDNVEVTPSDYDPFCITAPLDSRLPDGGGYPVCGLYDLNPTKLGKIDNYVKLSDNFGKQTEVFDGIDLTLSGRFRNGALLGGGVAYGRTTTDDCSVVVDSPQKRFCHVSAPFFRPQLKLNGSYRLPWGLQGSGTFQSIPGPQITAGYVARNPEIAPSLGRPLSGGSTVIVELIEPGTQFADHVNELDLRLAKIFTVRGMRLQTSMDLYNLLNGSGVQALNTRYGSAWQSPTTILLARFVKFGVQLDW